MNKLTSSIIYSLFVENKDSNWVFSPASYLEAMSNLAECLKGQNLAELLEFAPDIQEKQANGLETYNYLLYSEEYKDALQGAVVQALKERRTELEGFNGQEVVNRVNAIVREKTRGKIDNLISESDITEFTKFIILNCVYFKNKWLYPFEEKWSAEEFHGAKNNSSVKFLHHKITAGLTRYYEDSKVDIAELPYKDSDMACYLIVPKQGLFELFNDISGTIDKIAQVKPGIDLDVTVPAFKTESKFQLEEPTKTAGVKNIFNWTKDWSLVDNAKLNSEWIMSVQAIIQKAYIDFTKDGTEAAAATAILCGISGCLAFPKKEPPVKYIRADKPFMYVLANKNNPAKPLFIGVTYDIPNNATKTETNQMFVSGLHISSSYQTSS